MDNLTKRQKEILYTALEMFEDSIKVSLLSLKFMEKEAKEDPDFKSLNDSGQLNQEIEVANDLINELEIIKSIIEKEINSVVEDTRPKPKW